MFFVNFVSYVTLTPETFRYKKAYKLEDEPAKHNFKSDHLSLLSEQQQ